MGEPGGQGHAHGSRGEVPNSKAEGALLTCIVGHPALLQGGRRRVEDLADIGVDLDGDSASHHPVIVEGLHAGRHEVIEHHGDKYLPQESTGRGDSSQSMQGVWGCAMVLAAFRYFRQV
jgi:hypothetical protein